MLNVASNFMRWHYPHVIHEETHTQRGKMACTSPHRREHCQSVPGTHIIQVSWFTRQGLTQDTGLATTKTQRQVARVTGTQHKGKVPSSWKLTTFWFSSSTSLRLAGSSPSSHLLQGLHLPRSPSSSYGMRRPRHGGDTADNRLLLCLSSITFWSVDEWLACAIQSGRIIWGSLRDPRNMNLALSLVAEAAPQSPR